MWLMNVCLLLLSSGVLGCEAGKSQWWEKASFYQIYPRSFKDSDGDGLGDLKGITQQLPYLKEIGVTGTWLSPIFASPMADFGYDVSNFTQIDPIFGSMADFEALVETAKTIGLKIILDFVPNHTSDECEWFKKSAANDPFYKDFYIWHPGKIVNGVRQPPTNWISLFRGSSWTWNEERQAYYLHQFLAKQPDLNYRNPKVIETMKDIMRFWLRKGASGFRVDAIKYAFEIAPDSEGNYPDEPRNPNNNDPEDYNYLKHIYTEDQPETIDLVYQFRQVVDEMKEELGEHDDFILMTEAYSPIDVLMQYYGNSTHNGAHIPFNFMLISYLHRRSTAYTYETVINSWLEKMPAGRTANWVIGNHDQSRVATRFGEHKVDMFNTLLYVLPGCGITYQGEEIGMANVWISWEDTIDPQACQSNPDNYERLTRDPARTPFQWNDQPFAGFTTGPSTWLPVSDNYKEVNVMIERRSPLSQLNVYKQVKTLRMAPEFQNGFTKVKALSRSVLSVKRWLYSLYIVLFNLGAEMENINLSKEFNLPSSKLEYVLVTSTSTRRVGDVVNADNVEVMPNETVVLKAIEYDT